MAPFPGQAASFLRGSCPDFPQGQIGMWKCNSQVVTHPKLLWLEFFITVPGWEYKHCSPGSCWSLGYCPQDKVLEGLQDPASPSPGASSLVLPVTLLLSVRPTLELFHLPSLSHAVFPQPQVLPIFPPPTPCAERHPSDIYVCGRIPKAPNSASVLLGAH